MTPPADIFVQIAAYRDPELLPTLRDCLARAAQPERLRFGLCWQRDEQDSLEEFAQDPRFRVIEVPHQRGRGACWARQQTQSLYQGEAYTLQLDSHHRFVDGWDQLCIDMLEGLRAQGHPKPLLTSYVPVYEPTHDPAGRQHLPLRLRFGHFSDDGPIAVVPVGMDEFETLVAPEPARFFSAHFVFTLGCFCHEVPYDPALYFFGEEPSLALRAFTHGYDLFHPHRVVVWHHYGRTASPKHWSDHLQWSFRNERSMQRYRTLIREGLAGIGPEASELGPHGLGTVRSLKDYEFFCGLSFAARAVSQHAQRGLPPPEPLPPVDEAGLQALLLRPRCLDVPLAEVALVGGLEAQAFWYVGAHCAQGEELVRHDLRGEELAQALERGFFRLQFGSLQVPVRWTVWPYVSETGWGTPVSRPCGPEPEPL